MANRDKTEARPFADPEQIFKQRGEVTLDGRSDEVPEPGLKSTVVASPASSDAPEAVLDSEVSEVTSFAGPGINVRSAVKDTLHEFRRLDYSFLFPLRKFFSSDFLRKKAVTWVLTFGLLPMVISLVVTSFGLRFNQSAWLIGGYFCYFWAVYFHGLIKPSQSLWQRGLLYFCFTAFVGIPVLLAWESLPIVSTIYSGTESQRFLPRFIGFVFGVGALEETCKALPLLLFSLRRGPMQIRHGVFLGVMSGLGFALAEVVSYSIANWEKTAALSAAVIAQAAGDSQNWLGGVDASQFKAKLANIIPQLGDFYGAILTAQIVRFIPLPLIHAAWAGIVGWFIAVASIRPSFRWPTIIVGIAFTAVIHGCYDVFSNALIGLFLAACSIFGFMCYLMHGEETKTQAS